MMNMIEKRKDGLKTLRIEVDVNWSTPAAFPITQSEALEG